MKTFLKFFIDRPLLVNMMMAFFIFAGIISLTSIRYNTYPDIDNGTIVVETLFRGASAEEVELSVTVPLEKELLNIDGVTKLVSNSMEGLSFIQIICDPNENSEKYDEVELDVHRAIDRAMDYLPRDSRFTPQVKRIKTSNLPLMQVLVTGSVPEDTLRDIARRLRIGMRAIDGVAGVTLDGYREREVRIELDPLRIRQLGLNYDAIFKAVQSRNVKESGGSLDSIAGSQDVITIGKFEGPKDIANVILFQNAPGDLIRISDVASVAFDFSDPVVRYRVGGKHAIQISPSGNNSADKLATAQRITEFLAEKRPQMPADVSLIVVNNASVITQSMLDVLSGSAISGIVLVFLVLLAFFQLRFTIWVVLGIPTAILMVFMFMPLMGLTVNLMTMGALILMLGILVDDAVVTAESIFRHREYGYAPADAALIGTQKVITPVLASTLTTVIALAPMAFLGGVLGKIMYFVPVMAILVLAMSLIECKCLLPSHLAHSFQEGSSTRLSRPWFEKVEDFYETVMMKIVPHRYLFLGLVAIAFSIMAYVGSQFVVVAISPKADVDMIHVKAVAPVGTTFEKMESLLGSLEKEMAPYLPTSEVERVVITTGHQDYDAGEVTAGKNVSWGLVSIYLKPANERSVHSVRLQERLSKQFAGHASFESISVITQQNGPNVGWPLEAVVMGNSESRFEVAEKIRDYVASLDGVIDHWTSYQPGRPVISIKPNYEAISRYGVDVSDISKAVQMTFAGEVIDEFHTVEETIYYRMVLKDAGSQGANALRGITITPPAGEVIPLHSLVEFEQRAGEGTIRHYSGDQATTVFADIDRRIIGLTELNERVADFLREQRIYETYPDITVLLDGEYTSSAEQGESASKAFLFSIVGILYVLVLLFRSVAQPFIVLLLIPLGVIGVFFVFAIHQLEMSLAGMVGVAGLMGVIVNDALVMLDRFNRERTLHSESNGKSTLLHDRQIVECASVRLRPIVITTVTTFAGLFPGAYGIFGSYDLITPMLMVMLWGVAIASLTTLFLLPCLYAIERDLIGLFKPQLQRQAIDDVIMYN